MLYGGTGAACGCKARAFEQRQGWQEPQEKTGLDVTGIDRQESWRSIDVTAPDLRVLFVGFNPSPRSYDTGHPYAGRNNQFWRLLAAAGLTPRVLAATESRSLPLWGLGSTNLAHRPTARAEALSRAELRAGVPHVAEVVARCRPQIVAYTGKGVYLAASGRLRAAWGRQAESVFVGATDFVLPSPSGLVRLSFEAKLEWYQALARLAGRRARG